MAVSQRVKTSSLAVIVVVTCLFCSMKPAVTVTDADNGSRVEIKKGDLIAVQLTAQLSTGHGWKAVDTGVILELIGEPEQITARDRKPGAPEAQKFVFKGIERGEAALILHYMETWKAEAKPVKEFRVTVTVR